MKNILCTIAFILTMIVSVGAFASCNAVNDEENIGGDQLSQDKVTFEPDEEFAGNFEMVSEGRVYFHSEQKREALLVDSRGSLLWLYSDEEGFFDDLDTGDYVRVAHGMVMETYPGQTYAEKIVLLDDGDINSFTDEEWKRLNEVFTEPIER